MLSEIWDNNVQQESHMSFDDKFNVIWKSCYIKDILHILAR